MYSKSHRINITIEPAIAAILARLAKKHGQSVSAVTRKLIIEELERQEDMSLASLSERRDVGKLQTISHEMVWQ